MDWDELIASLDKQINEIETKEGFDTFSSDDSLKENNKLNPEEELEKKLAELLSKYQTTKNISLLTDFLDLIEDVKYPKLKQYLMLQFDDGKTILEVISTQGVNLDYSLNLEILKDPDLVRILIQSKNKEAFTFSSEKDLLLEVDGITVVEHLIKEHIFQKFWLSKISSSPIIIDILVKYDKKDYFVYLSEEQLFMPFEDGIVLDYLFKNDLFNYSTIGNIKSNTKIYDYIIKYKRYDKLSEISESLLTEKIGEKYILDLILEHNQSPGIYGLRNPELLGLIIEKNRLDLLENVASSALTTIVPDEGVILFEYLLDHGIIPVEGIKSITGGYDTGDKLFKIIAEKNRYDLLTKVSEARLLQKHGDKTLFEILIENNVPVELNSISKPETVNLTQAQNALLKILEEPPEGVKILLLTKSADAMLSTVRSRARLVRMQRFTAEEISSYLTEREPALRRSFSSDEALFELLLSAGGSIGRAVKLLSPQSQSALKKEREETLSVLKALAERSYSPLFSAISALPQKREELSRALDRLHTALCDLVLLKRAEAPPLAFFPKADAIPDELLAFRIDTLFLFTDAVERGIAELERNANVTTTKTALAYAMYRKRDHLT